MDPADLRIPAVHLQILNLSHCDISELPADLGAALPSLTELNLSNNRLTTLPASICASCAQLASLSLQNNLLVQMPPGLSRLTSLRQLFASDNQIEDIFDHVFKGLRTLELLDVSRNMLQQLPGKGSGGEGGGRLGEVSCGGGQASRRQPQHAAAAVRWAEKGAGPQVV